MTGRKPDPNECTCPGGPFEHGPEARDRVLAAAARRAEAEAEAAKAEQEGEEQ